MMADDWGTKLENAMGETMVETDISVLVGVAAEAARSASWWQAQCQGRDAVIAELREQVRWLRERIDRMESDAIPVGDDVRLDGMETV